MLCRVDEHQCASLRSPHGTPCWVASALAATRVLDEHYAAQRQAGCAVKKSDVLAAYFESLHGPSWGQGAAVSKPMATPFAFVLAEMMQKMAVDVLIDVGMGQGCLLGKLRMLVGPDTVLVGVENNELSARSAADGMTFATSKLGTSS